MTNHFFGDTAVLTRRSLRHIARSLDTIITTAIMPIAFMLLFVYVFGGAIDTGTAYVNYVVPGIIILCAGFGSAGASFMPATAPGPRHSSAASSRASTPSCAS